MSGRAHWWGPSLAGPLGQARGGRFPENVGSIWKEGLGFCRDLKPCCTVRSSDTTVCPGDSPGDPDGTRAPLRPLPSFCGPPSPLPSRLAPPPQPGHPPARPGAPFLPLNRGAAQTLGCCTQIRFRGNQRRASPQQEVGPVADTPSPTSRRRSGVVGPQASQPHRITLLGCVALEARLLPAGCGPQVGAPWVSLGRASVLTAVRPLSDRLPRRAVRARSASSSPEPHLVPLRLTDAVVPLTRSWMAWGPSSSQG